MALLDYAVAELVRFQPLDPPGYQVFYTTILVLVLGAAVSVAFRKILDRKSIEVS